MTDAKNGSNLIYLPLDKLVSQAAGNGEAAGAKANVTQPAQAPAAASPAPADLAQSIELQRQKDARSRDTRESRDREAR
jgi:membrane protease subunit HflK